MKKKIRKFAFQSNKINILPMPGRMMFKIMQNIANELGMIGMALRKNPFLKLSLLNIDCL